MHQIFVSMDIWHWVDGAEVVRNDRNSMKNDFEVREQRVYCDLYWIYS